MGLRLAVMRNWTKNLSGAVAVYIAMAACSGEDAARHFAEVADSGAQGGSGGLPAGDSGRGASGGAGASGGEPGAPEAGLLDRLVRPVGDARAQEAGVPVPTQQSGDRIKARWLVGDDGSRQFLGWWDSELGTECEWLTADDGAHRCLPVTEVQVDHFSDPGCTVPAALVGGSGCGATGEYGRRNVQTVTCSAPLLETYSIGAEIATIYSGQPGFCNEHVNLTNGQTRHSATLVAASSLVSASIITD